MQTRTRQITTSVRIATWTNTARPRIPSIAAAMSPTIACRSLLIQRVARMERSEMRDSQITLRSIRAACALIQTTEDERQTPDELNDAAERRAALVNNKENTSAAATAVW